jgi:hypothetical protein
MEISTLLEKKRWTADFAYLNKENREFIIKKDPYPALPWQNSDISLKDVKYKIYEGVLYIKGTRIYYYNIPNLFLDFDSWGSTEPYYEICKLNNDKLVTPFIETDIYVKRWLLPNKWVKGVDLRDPNILKWHLAKQEDPFEFAMSSFKLREK